mgnify:CR=1 FL=1
MDFNLYLKKIGMYTASDSQYLFKVMDQVKKQQKTEIYNKKKYIINSFVCFVN